MAISLTKQAIDLGIITTRPEPMLAFYRDLLGLRHEASVELPGGTVMHRLWCGESLIKILQHRKDPPASAPPGGIAGASGYRYFTMTVDNLEEMAALCEAAGYKLAVPVTNIRPGVRIAIVEDPDGNWVEFLSD